MNSQAFALTLRRAAEESKNLIRVLVPLHRFLNIMEQSIISLDMRLCLKLWEQGSWMGWS